MNGYSLKESEEVLLNSHQVLEQKVWERTRELEQTATQLKSEIAERELVEQTKQRIFESQQVVNQVLKTATESLTLEEQLQKALNVVLSLPWLAILSKGTILGCPKTVFLVQFPCPGSGLR